MTGLPYIARLGAGVIFAAVGDYIRRKGMLTTGWIRKIFMIFCKRNNSFKKKWVLKSFINF